MTAALTHTTTADPPPAGDALPGDAAPASPRRPAAETVRLYAADWNAFLAWCKGEDLAALPAAPATVAAFLNAGGATLSARALAGGRPGGERVLPKARDQPVDLGRASPRASAAARTTERLLAPAAASARTFASPRTASDHCLLGCRAAVGAVSASSRPRS